MSLTSPNPRYFPMTLLVVVSLLLGACGSNSATEADDAATLTATSHTTVHSDTDSDAEAVGGQDGDAAGGLDPAIAALVLTAGNPDADTVIVNSQGGPAPELFPAAAVAEHLGLAVTEDVLIVTVHQQQTIDRDRFNDADLTFDEAVEADAQSVADLAQVVEYFVNDDRKVIVTGVSFGAFMGADLLVTQGPIADAYLLAVGRLDMPEAVWSEFAEGRTVGFVNGVDVIEVPIEDAGMGGDSAIGDRNMSRLAAGLGHKRYTEELVDTDLSKVVYVSGNLDEQVGRLTTAEVAFLEQKGASLITYEGGHDVPSDVLSKALGAVGLSSTAPNGAGPASDQADAGTADDSNEVATLEVIQDAAQAYASCLDGEGVDFGVEPAAADRDVIFDEIRRVSEADPGAHASCEPTLYVIP